MHFVFWISLLFVVYTYLGYPLIIVLWSKLFPKPVRLNMESFEWPSVTMVIIAYNEEKTILRKIENCRKLEYPKELLEICIVSDGSTDQTNDILEAQTDMHIIIDKVNHGKPYQINRAIHETQSDVIVFADARQTFEKNAIKQLVRNFSDPKIGAVSGELVFLSPADHTERSVGLYWQYEKLLRKAESSINSTIGVTGAIYAIKRELFSPIPDDTILDDVEIPLRAFRDGYRSIFESDARAIDTAAANVAQEFKRKVRTLTGNFQLFHRNPWIFNPVTNSIVFQVLSHKVFRLIVPYALITVLVTSLLANNSFYVVFFYVQMLFYLAGTCTALFSGLKKNSFLNLTFVFLSLLTASVIALFNYMFNQTDARWRK